MSLEVETGSASASAEAYASVAQADVYLAARGYSLWAGLSESEREQALRRASAFMRRYAFKGQRVSSTQALDWPRIGVFAHNYPVGADTVPPEVAQACIELAFRAASGELSPDLGQAVLSKSVGPISVTYQAGSNTTRRYPALDALLRAYLTASAGSQLGVQRA